MQVIRKPRAEYVNEGEHILLDGRRREVTETARSQRLISFWFDGRASVNPDWTCLESDRVTVVA